MSVTIADCLKLPSLRSCRVIAGERGLNHLVNSASVLEVFDTNTFDIEQPVSNSDLLLTSFASIKEDYHLQCRHIERLYESGDAGLVIYYVGVYLERIHPSLIETADRLGFPLMVMPEGRIDCFYNEVLREVYELLLRDKNHASGLIDNIAALVGRLPENRKNLSTLLQLISDHLKCTVFLSDLSQNSVAMSKWPAANEITADEICRLYEAHAESGSLMIETQRQGMPLRIFCVPFSAFEYRNFSLYAADESGALTLDDVYHIIECLQVFSKLWDMDESSILENALVPAIIEGNDDRLRSAAARLGIDLKAINTAVIVRPDFGNLEPNTEANTEPNMGSSMETKERLRLMRSMIKELKECSTSMGKEIIADTYGIYIVCFIIYSHKTDGDLRYIDELIESLDSVYDRYTISVFPNDSRVEDVRRTYQIYTSYIPDVTKIFPHKKELSYGDLLLGKACRDMMEERTEEYRICRNILLPLLQEPDGDELLHTLAVYYLDADGQVKTTADQLYLHRNTVKYRLGKIRDITNFDAADRMSAYLLYKAIACWRLDPEMGE